ncbi:hypothetical protein Pve01_36250 [Planomonospora venezuelensis]|nr:hypothetical protein Pve01_36250 [Planomonospora venezuelensis]
MRVRTGRSGNRRCRPQGTRIADGAGGVTDEAWADAAEHYDENQLAALVSLIALINAFNARTSSSGSRPATTGPVGSDDGGARPAPRGPPRNPSAPPRSGRPPPCGAGRRVEPRSRGMDSG